MRDQIGRLACAIALALALARVPGLGVAFFVWVGISAGLVFVGAIWSFHLREFALVNLALVLVWLLIVFGIGRHHRAVDGSVPASTG